MKTIYKFKAFSPSSEDFDRREYLVEAPTMVLAKSHLISLGFFDIDFVGIETVYLA